MTAADQLAELEIEVVGCRACPRLVAWREQVAVEKRAAYRDETYWGRPIPGYGDPAARIAVVGLAPAAHGANRTGRIFTGDRSGDWLFRAMHRAGLANQSTARYAGDGLRLDDVWVTATVKCAPPANRPTPAERDACAPFLTRELAVLDPVVVVCLGAFGFEAACRHYGVRPRPASSTARANTPSSMGGVSRPVNVFCWLGWNEHTSVRPLSSATSTPCPNRGRGVTPRCRHAASYPNAPRHTTTRRSLNSASSRDRNGAQASRSSVDGRLPGGAHLTAAVTHAPVSASPSPAATDVG